MNDTTIKTPTDVIVKAMENAEEMESVIILYQMKRVDGNGGIGWISNISGTTEKIGLLEEGKLGIFGNAYGIKE